MRNRRMWRLRAISILAAVSGIVAIPGIGQTSRNPAPQNQAKGRTAAPQQAPPDSPSAKHPLESLKFTGNKRISSDKIALATGLTIGQGAESEDFEAARRRLLVTGAFESVGFSYEPSKTGAGYDATFELVEVAQMFPYSFEDLPASDDILRAVVAREMPIFGDEIPAARAILDRLERALTAALDGKVTVQAHMLATLHGGEPKIVFRLPGERPRVAEVRFSGNKAITTSKLAMTFAEVATGVEFKDAGIRTLLDQSIRPLYEARGYIRVAFTKVTAEKSAEKDIDGVAVSVAIDEGPEFKLGKIRFAGGSPRDLDKLAGLRTGDLADFDEVKMAQNRIIEKYKTTGYLHAAVKQERTVHDDEGTVDLLLTVEPGPQFAYGKLIVEGLDVIGEPAIRKLWGEREGKPFDAAFPEAFLKDVRDQGMFDNLGKTSSSTKVNEDAKTVDVTLTFEGTKGNGGRDRRLREQF